MILLELALLLQLIMQSPPAAGANADGAAPGIQIRHADNAEYNSEKGEIILTGAVHVVRATMSIRADKIQLLLADEGGGLKEGVATGRVEIIDGQRRAEAKRAVYVAKTSDIILTGSPSLWDGGNQISAERIIYNIKSRSMKAEGQVSGIFKEQIGAKSAGSR